MPTRPSDPWSGAAYVGALLGLVFLVLGVRGLVSVGPPFALPGEARVVATVVDRGEDAPLHPWTCFPAYAYEVDGVQYRAHADRGTRSCPAEGSRAAVIVRLADPAHARVPTGAALGVVLLQLGIGAAASLLVVRALVLRRRRARAAGPAPLWWGAR